MCVCVRVCVFVPTNNDDDFDLICYMAFATRGVDENYIAGSIGIQVGCVV